VVERLRADLARGRIETTTEPVERIAEAVGFGGSENMRRAFIRIFGQPPQSIRRAIRSASAARGEFSQSTGRIATRLTRT
jgi:transcriptional regulator GlxA family with amidase domain